ncbi:MAG: hypothetical protein NUV86_02820 [Candidatus Scalindua sp.]|nr:hypothetical protein [Candidatus Scalindua sp.]MCR4344024.1 hypothetical protein [Candidatus Scalindua sp.]
MGKSKTEVKVEAALLPVLEEMVIVLSDNKFRIIGIIDGHYIVQTPKGLKKPKVLN